jgi:catechol 2,3-dioxygenase-like lactoylglutathione lyase family enzyme
VRKSKYGGTLGGSANLTGEFLEMLWDDSRSGRLIVKGVTGFQGVFMEPRISIITLGVSDLNRSVRFYKEGLGLPLREANDRIAFFETKGTWLALFPLEALAEDAAIPADGTGFSGFTLAHNVRSMEEVDAVLEEAAASGAKIMKPAGNTSWGGYSGYFADPDGYLWEVAWNPHFWVE